MDNYKDRYDNIVSKLLELIKKEKELDNIEEEIEINLEKMSVCSEELVKLEKKKYEMKYKVASNKRIKCFSKMFLIIAISALVTILVTGFLLQSVWLKILFVILYFISSNYIHYNMYLKKKDDKNYLYGELENSIEYKNLIDQTNNKKENLNQFRLEDERLMNKVSELHSETMYLYTMIYGFIEEEEIQRGIDETLTKGVELDIKYAENKRLVRRRKKITEIKNND